MPAKAGIQYSAADICVYWVPAFAGTTGRGMNKNAALQAHHRI